jgi:hypothetical protein
MIFSALISTAVAAPTYDEAQTGGLIKYHTLDKGLGCVWQHKIQGSTSAAVGTAYAKTNDDLLKNYVSTSSRTPQGIIVNQQNQSYSIEIIAHESDDPELLLSLFVRNIDANLLPGQLNANVKFIDNRGQPVKFANVATEAVYFSDSPILKKAYKKWPRCLTIIYFA